MLYTLCISPRSTYHHVNLSGAVIPISVCVHVSMFLSTARVAIHEGQLTCVLYCVVFLLADKSSVNKLYNSLKFLYQVHRSVQCKNATSGDFLDS